MVSDKQLSREISSLCRIIIARLDEYELERMEASNSRNEALLNRLSEVVNGDVTVSQKNEYVGESWRAGGVEVAEGCTDFCKSGTSYLCTLDSPREEVSTGGSETHFQVGSCSELNGSITYQDSTVRLAR